MISRVVQCDYDGDKLLVTNNKTLINVAERNMEGIVPLFYDMRKAAAEPITPENLFKGLLLAYNGGNIGSPSNDITKIWNSGKINDERLKVIKWLVAEVNYTIDYAKTLYKPVRPDEINKIITKYTKSKVPHFFMYAKDKKSEQVKNRSECTVDRIVKLFPKKKFNFNFKQENIGKFDYRMLMSNPDVEIIPEIADTYKKISSTLNFRNLDDTKLNNYVAVFDDAKQRIFDMPYDNDIILDNIIYDLFCKRNTPLKRAFWYLFGDEVYENISKNLSDGGLDYCPRCHKRFYKSHKNQKYCPKCQGYVKQKTKTIVCCDCGKEFEVDARNMKKIRCDECQKKHDKENTKNRVRKYRQTH